MKTTDYEVIAKEITGQEGKYIGDSTVLLQDGSRVQIGDMIALLTRTIDDIEETTIYHLVNGKWMFGSSSYVKHLGNGEYEVFGALEKIMTFKEASEKWNVSTSNLRNNVRNGRFEDDEVRKSGEVWLVTERAMKRLYGEPKGL